MPMLHNHRVLYIIACQKWDHNYMYVNVFCTHSLATVLTKCHDFYDDLKLSTSLAAGEWWSNWSFPQLFGSWHWHPEAFMKPLKTKLEPSGTPNFGVEQVSGYCLAHGVRKKQLSLAQSQSFVIGCNRCCKAQNGNYFRWCRCCTPPAWKRIISRLGHGRPCVQRWLWPFPKAAEGEAAEWDTAVAGATCLSGVEEWLRKSPTNMVMKSIYKLWFNQQTR